MQQLLVKGAGVESAIKTIQGTVHSMGIEVAA
jgi:ribosomal protein L11